MEKTNIKWFMFGILVGLITMFIPFMVVLSNLDKL